MQRIARDKPARDGEDLLARLLHLTPNSGRIEIIFSR
jgi:hypothetical protein